MRNILNIEHEFEIYQRYFGEIINLDKQFGKILLKIKSGYEAKISYIENSIVLNLKKEIKEIQSLYAKESACKKIFTKKLEKLAQENVELSRTLDETESRYNVLACTLQEISTFNINNIPKDESTWRALIFENSRLSQYNKEMQIDLKNIAFKEKKLISLLMALKDQGCPVEEIYEKQITKQKSFFSPQTHLEDTDNEALVSDRIKIVAKPSIIPMLNLGELSPGYSCNNYFY